MKTVVYKGYMIEREQKKKRQELRKRKGSQSRVKAEQGIIYLASPNTRRLGRYEQLSQ
jgi:hypothetical protein